MEDETTNRVIEMAVAVQQIPAPTFEEGDRAAFVQAHFLDEGLKDVEADETGNIYGRWSSDDGSKRDAPPLVVSAHLDTVFPRGTDLRLTLDPSASLCEAPQLGRTVPERIHGPGIGDNSIGVAALFGLIWSLRAHETRLPADVWFVANTCEEGLGDLRGMKAVVDRFGSQVAAYLIVEGMAYEHIYHRAVAVQRYRISARTAGGHAWSDYGQPSAVHELAALTTQIASLKLSVEPRTTLNVGKIEGGTSVNTLAAEAILELDMRSESPEGLTELVSRVDALIEMANSPGVRMEVESIGQRPGGSIPVHHPLVELAVSCSRSQGIEPKLIGGSTDANVPLSRGIPAVVLGVTTGGGAHTLAEYVDVEPVGRGMATLIGFMERVVDR